jgi:hypothetical protein
MRNIVASVAIIICLSLGVWQIKTEGHKEQQPSTTVTERTGMQCPALYGVPGATVDQDLPSSIKHCKCEIGAMLEQKDGSFRCSYCGKTENE